MNNKPRRARSGQSAQEQNQNLGTVVEQHFDNLSSQEPIVEHMTIPAFLRRIEHRWNLDDIRRFGDKVGQIAESMQLGYLTTVDSSLGVIRTFPLPMMQRVYAVMRAQFGWPQLPEADEKAGEVQRLKQQARSTEKAGQRLREMLGETDNVDLLEIITKAAEHVEAEAERLRATAAAPALAHVAS